MIQQYIKFVYCTVINTTQRWCCGNTATILPSYRLLTHRSLVQHAATSHQGPALLPRLLCGLSSRLRESPSNTLIDLWPEPRVRTSATRKSCPHFIITRGFGTPPRVLISIIVALSFLILRLIRSKHCPCLRLARLEALLFLERYVFSFWLILFSCTGPGQVSLVYLMNSL